MAPAPLRLKIGGVDASVVAEVNASFLVDIKKVGAEIGKKIVVRAGVKMLEREAAQQGLKVLSGHAARAVLKDLGPLAAAFGVGWDLGEVLNAYKVAPEAAGSHRESQSRPSRRRETNSSKPSLARRDGRVAPCRAPRVVPHGARPLSRSGQRHHQQLGCTRNQDPLRAEHGDRTDEGQQRVDAAEHRGPVDAG